MDPARFSTLSRLNDALQWTGSADRAQGVLCLSSPVKVNTTLSIDDDKYPVILLLRLLHAASWSYDYTSTSIIHTPDSGKALSVKNVTSKRFYYKALLRLQNIWDLGVRTLPSDQSQSFYRLLLHGVRALPNHGDKVYMQALKNNADALAAVTVLPLTSGRAIAPAPVLPALADDDESDAEILGANVDWLLQLQYLHTAVLHHPMFHQRRLVLMQVLRMMSRRWKLWKKEASQ